MTTSHRSFRLPSSWVRGTIGAVVLFLLLEALTRAELVTPTYLPPASSIVKETFGLLSDPEFWSAFTVSMYAWLMGMIRAILIAVPLGLVLGLSKRAYNASITIIELLRPIPSVSLIPLAIIVYGRGADMKIFLVAFACVWPILFNTIYGMRAVDPVAIDTARAFGLGRFRIAMRVSLRAASPFIFTGLKIASSVALILVVSSEIIAGGADGLGIMLASARQLSDLQASYAITLMTGVIGLSLYLIFQVIERLLFSWNIDGQAE